MNFTENVLRAREKKRKRKYERTTTPNTHLEKHSPPYIQTHTHAT